MRQGLANQGYQNEAGRFNADAQNQFSLLGMEIGHQQYLAKLDDLRAREMQQEDIGYKRDLAQMDDDLKRWSVEQDRQMQEYIAGLETSQQTRQQFIESSNELMQQYQIQYREVMTNPDMTPEAREQAIENLQKMYNTSMQLSADMLEVPLYFDDDNIAGIGRSGGTTGDAQDGTGTGGTPAPSDPTQRGDDTPDWVAQGDDEVAQGIREFQTRNDANTRFTTRYNPQIKEYTPENHVRDKSHNAFLSAYDLGDQVYTLGDKHTLPTAQDIGQTPPPDDGTFDQWLKSPASKFWRYDNRDTTIAQGGRTVKDSDFSAIEKQVYKAPDVRDVDQWYQQSRK
jgi:hypothetical protein